MYVHILAIVEIYKTFNSLVFSGKAVVDGLRKLLYSCFGQVLEILFFDVNQIILFLL